MRESRKTEKMRLPRDSMEEWLESQAPKPHEIKHEKPPKDVFEAWMEKRVEKSREGKKMEAQPAA